MRELLNHKVAIVTEAGNGVGKATALALGALGMRVGVHSVNPDRAQGVADAIVQAGGQAIPIGANISNKFQCVHVVEKTREAWGQLDVLVNCAGIFPTTPLLKIDEWEWNRVLEINLKGTFMMCQLVGRVMADENKERGGLMINLAGTGGIDHALAGQAVVCAANAGILGFSRECAHEYADYNIRVHTLLQDDQDPPLPQTVAQTIVDLCQQPSSDQIIRV
jgi:NAD(P)-dependent dehydrogenase (short-subunit alcohol dehydrogenase family)